jgi:hypothetical protein
VGKMTVAEIVVIAMGILLVLNMLIIFKLMERINPSSMQRIENEIERAREAYGVENMMVHRAKKRRNGE